MKVELELRSDEAEAVRKLARAAGCTPDRVVHWALGNYLRLAPHAPEEPLPPAHRASAA
jgi:hypothetical protein